MTVKNLKELLQDVPDDYTIDLEVYNENGLLINVYIEKDIEMVSIIKE